MAELWDQYDLVLTYKIIHNLTTIPTPWILKHSIHNHSLIEMVGSANHLQIHKPPASSSRQTHSFFHRAVPKWNALPLDIRDATSIESFKTQLLKHQRHSRSLSVE
eukprot:GHVN01010244.1.p1 GENE.GHVN01010244.1~~GHVN01010244.1.p1  ORF type:complete len:106 (-),score=7.65 GHVN01010244.1:8-325(-)